MPKIPKSATRSEYQRPAPDAIAILVWSRPGISLESHRSTSILLKKLNILLADKIRAKG